MHEVNTGTHVDPDEITVGAWLHKWLAGATVSPRSHEAYTTAVNRLVGAIGHVKLQKLRPIHVHEMKLLRRDGSKVSPRTFATARRVLKAALQQAADLELVSRNVASSGRAPTVETGEVDILAPEEITAVLEALHGSDLYPIVAVALGTGMRRGELLALRWQDVNLAGAVVTVARSLEHTTRHGYRFKAPKTRAGRRKIPIPAEIVEVLRDHRRQQLELRMSLGMGKLEPDALVFCRLDGQPLPPNHVTARWREAVGGKWKFHALRHTHASALIAGGIDVVSVSSRLGHSNPTITLKVYSHLFRRHDTSAADVIGRVLGANRVPSDGAGA